VAVAAAGGTVIVQDPQDARVPGMPLSVIAADSPERIVPADAIAGVLDKIFAQEPAANPKGGSPLPLDPEPPRPDGSPSAFQVP
jgi:two-component system, chemotaxis family, protein-glutamate methylesterase/glutaminase